MNDSLDIKKDSLEIKNENKKSKKSFKLFGIGLIVGLGLGAVVGAVATGVGLAKFVDTSLQLQEYNELYGYNYDGGSYFSSDSVEDYADFESGLQKFKALSFEQQKDLLTEYLNYSIEESVKSGDTEMVNSYEGILNSVNASTTSDELVNLINAEDKLLLMAAYDYEYAQKGDERLRQEFVSMSFEEQKALLTEHLTSLINDIEVTDDNYSAELVDIYNEQLEYVNNSTTSEELISIVDNSSALLVAVYNHLNGF